MNQPKRHDRDEPDPDEPTEAERTADVALVELFDEQVLDK